MHFTFLDVITLLKFLRQDNSEKKKSYVIKMHLLNFPLRHFAKWKIWGDFGIQESVAFLFNIICHFIRLLGVRTALLWSIKLLFFLKRQMKYVNIWQFMFSWVAFWPIFQRFLEDIEDFFWGGSINQWFCQEIQ